MDEPVHFLHIRKTGGMAIRAALKPVAEAFGTRLAPHKTRLADVAAPERAFFFVRDPVVRFVSGFNSRLRMGRPLLDRPWNDGEARAFAAFQTANALAEALARDDPAALDAMGTIRHINQPLSYWIGSEELVRSCLDRIVWIGWTQTLAADFEEIKRRLGLPPAARLPDDDLTSHRTPEGMDVALSASGRGAVERWYAHDLRLLDVLKDLREQLR